MALRLNPGTGTLTSNLISSYEKHITLPDRGVELFGKLSDATMIGNPIAKNNDSNFYGSIEEDSDFVDTFGFCSYKPESNVCKDDFTFHEFSELCVNYFINKNNCYTNNNETWNQSFKFSGGRFRRIVANIEKNKFENFNLDISNEDIMMKIFVTILLRMSMG